MADKTKSPYGDEIVIHRERAESARQRSSRDGRFLPAISKHIERHVGPIKSVFHEVASKDVHIDIHHVPPSATRPFHTLVTSGMSDEPMNAPPGAEECRLAELMLTLPAERGPAVQEFDEASPYWPVRLLRDLGRFPHSYGTWLWFGHTVPNGDPPRPYDRSTKLCGSILLPSPSVPPDFWSLLTPDGFRIGFFAVVPLYAEELDFKLRAGVDSLGARLNEHGISDVVDPQRSNVCGGRRRRSPRAYR
jgi:hypothetical protein